MATFSPLSSKHYQRIKHLLNNISININKNTNLNKKSNAKEHDSQ